MLNLYKIDNGNYVPLDLNFRNVVGTPIQNVRIKGEGNVLSGIYELTFSGVNAGNTATCYIDAFEPKHPYENLSGQTVDLDGSSWQEIIPDIEVQFSNSAAFDDTWKGKIYIGAYYDSNNNQDIQVLDIPTVVAGNESVSQRIAVRNDGGDLEANCQLFVVNGARFKNINGEGFSEIIQTEINLPYKATASDYYEITLTYNSSSNTVDLKVDTLNADVTDTTDGTVYAGGSGIPIDTSKIYEISSGDLTGLRFKLASITQNSTIHLYTSDMSNYVLIAPDVSGSEGTYVSGASGIDLTEDGGSTTGEISAGSTAFFWLKVSPPTTATKDHNMRYSTIVIKSYGV